MANLNFNPVQAYQGEVKMFAHVVTIGATGAVSSETAGTGLSVARASAGVYTCTLKDYFPSLLLAVANSLDTDTGAGTGAYITEEWTNPAAADDDAIITNIASTAGIQVLDGADLNGAIGDGAISPPRNITLTLSNHADWDATTAVLAGTDVHGAVLSENFAIPNGGNTTVVGVKAFATITSLTIPAQAAGGGTGTLGTGALIGLSRKAKTRAGTISVINETAAGSRVTNGVYAVAATGLPNGTYAPNSAPDGSRDYALTYELDPTDNVLGTWQLTADAVSTAKTFTLTHKVNGAASDPVSGVKVQILALLRNSTVTP